MVFTTSLPSSRPAIRSSLRASSSIASLEASVGTSIRARTLQNREFAAAADRGFTAVKHQREVGAGYFDAIATTVDPNSSTTALKGSTEEGQF
ncbi:Isocitrate lyase [Corynebacterium aquatimens]|nr:Isocitrate lyase [Corynebacterium aquatimens]